MKLPEEKDMHCMKKVFLTVLITMWMMSSAVYASEVYTTTTDYETGGHGIFDPAAASVQTGAAIYTDAVARSFNGKIYVIERFGADNITVFDKTDLSTPLIQFSVGAGANPHDILVLNRTKAYVTRYGSAELLIVNPTDGSQLGTIDLSGFADEDGFPEMDLMVAAGGKVFVSLQRLYNFSPTSLSQVVVIDPETDQIIDTDAATAGVQAINLTRTNPIDMKYVASVGKILVAEAADAYSTADGGLEYIDVSTYAAEGILVSEEALGGNLGGAFGAFDMIDSTEGYAIVADALWTTHVVRFDLAAGTADTVISGSGYDHADVLVLNNELILADRNFSAPGIRVFDAVDDSEITGSPVSTGLPPFCLVEIQDADDPVALIFGEYSWVTLLFHFIMDDVLSQTEEGQALVDLYYALSPLIIVLMQM